MAGAGRVLLVLFLAAAAAGPAIATDYTVGDTQGWTSGVDYSTWASGKNFTVGDTLLFQYSGLHSVDEVTQSNYASCSTSGPITTSNSGSTKISLTAAGSRYFICGTPGHCSGGMKLAVTTSAAAGPGSGSTPGASPPPPGSSSNSPPSSGSSPPPPPGGNNAAAGGGLRAAALGSLIGLGIALAG